MNCCLTVTHALYRDKFRDEALLLSLCRHPHIVRIENAFALGAVALHLNEICRRGRLYIRQMGEALLAVHY
jgi:hypothetical protein